MLPSSYVVPPDVTMQLLDSGGTVLQLSHGYSITRLWHENSIKWATSVLPSVVLQSCLHGVQAVGGTPPDPHHELYGFSTSDVVPTLPGGTTRLRQIYYAVAVIAILLCSQFSLMNTINIFPRLSIITSTAAHF